MEHHLFHARPDGAILSVDADCSSGMAAVSELSPNLTNQTVSFSWTSGDDVEDPALAARLAQLCRDDDGEVLWHDGCEPEGARAQNKGCRHARHLHTYGAEPSVLPVDVPPSAAPLPQYSELPHRNVEGIPEVQGCPPFRLLAEHVYTNTPLLMRGCTHEMPAAQKWLDDEYLFRTAGDWRGQHGAGNDIDDATSYTLHEFLTRAARGARDLPYLPWRRLPLALRRDLPPISTFACLTPLAASLISDIHVRFTDRSHVLSSLHFDGGDFFSFQIDGVKNWTMVGPRHALGLYSDFVYPPPGPSYGLQVFRRAGVDVRRLPRILDTPTLTASAGPGDAVYIPQRWWHEVVSLRGRNVGVVLQTNFPPPTAIHSAGDAEWSPRFYSRDLLQFARRWRRDGTAGMPKSLRALCADAVDGAGVSEQGVRQWEAALNATDRENDDTDNSRSDDVLTGALRGLWRIKNGDEREPTAEELKIVYHSIIGVAGAAMEAA